jgi:hypothetical protein
VKASTLKDASFSPPREEARRSEVHSTDAAAAPRRACFVLVRETATAGLFLFAAQLARFWACCGCWADKLTLLGVGAGALGASKAT